MAQQHQKALTRFTLFLKHLLHASTESYKRLSGGYSEGDPPVSIPNTVVKPFSADDTSGATPRESKSLPGNLSQGRHPPALIST